MLLRSIFDDKLAQSAYLIGCQRTGEAIVIDPERDVDRYIEAAKKEGLRITAIAETHIHADYLSGGRELAERLGGIGGGAKLYLSGEGGREWSYRWLEQREGGGLYPHQLLKDGDTFRVGHIELKTVHTPGHTPEHICFLVTDRGSGATEPMGIVSGDFVFVGDLGRPDLLETAAGKHGAKEPAARALFESVRTFAGLPDFLQVWPAHGAGSACGKALGAVPQTTVGYEKRFNAAIRTALGQNLEPGQSAEADFVRDILAGQPEPPLYFARMKRLNRDGPPLLGELPRPEPLRPEQLKGLSTQHVAVIDTRPWNLFREGHLPGALSIPLDNTFPTIAGSYLREDEPMVLIVEESRGGVQEAVRCLVRVGLDDIAGYATPASLEEYARRGGKLASTPEIDAAAAKERFDARGGLILDVRRAAEYQDGHIAGALNVVHTRLPEALARIPKDKPILVHCRSGVRSARAAAYLQRAGYDATNLAGGMLAWEAAALPVER
jgi:hydroxyacylglutathione hydrolase